MARPGRGCDRKGATRRVPTAPLVLAVLFGIGLVSVPVPANAATADAPGGTESAPAGAGCDGHPSAVQTPPLGTMAEAAADASPFGDQDADDDDAKHDASRSRRIFAEVFTRATSRDDFIACFRGLAFSSRGPPGR